MKYLSITNNKITAKQFVEIWSEKYKTIEARRKGVKERYYKNISIRPMTRKSVLELIKWKNGYNDKIAKPKLKIVNFFLLKKNIETINNLTKKWNQKKFEEIFEPGRNAPIWKMFLMHIIHPNRFPIFDVNVYRAFRYLKLKKICELKDNKLSTYYIVFLDEFFPFFQRMKSEANCNVKQLDEALWAYGRFLKNFGDCVS